MKEIREYIQEQIKFYNNTFESNSRVRVNDVLMNLQYLLELVDLTIREQEIEINEDYNKQFLKKKPELKEGDTWLVKIGDAIRLERFKIKQIKGKAISKHVYTTEVYEINEYWYKISDIEWVERIEG